MAKKRPPLPSRMVLVEWDDACAQDNPWTTHKKLLAQKPVRVHSIGFVVADEPDHLTICNSVVQDDGMLGGDNTIPRGMIKKVTELK